MPPRSNNRPRRYMRERAIRLGLVVPGPFQCVPQRLVRDDTVTGGWRVLPYIYREVQA